MIDINSSTLSEEKPKPRKSRLSCGRRRSKSFVGGPGVAADFHLLIPMQLSSAERLKQLFRMSFRYALLTSCHEFREDPNFDMNSVIDDGLKEYDRIESLLGKDFDLCVAEPTELNQSENSIISKYIEGIEVLQTESNEWDAIIKQEEEKLQKMMDSSIDFLTENGAVKEPFEDIPSCDYGELLNNTNNMLEGLTILTDALSNHADGPSSLLRRNVEYLKHIETIASEKLKTDSIETPRTTLRNFQHKC